MRSLAVLFVIATIVGVVVIIRMRHRIDDRPIGQGAPPYERSYPTRTAEDTVDVSAVPPHSNPEPERAGLLVHVTSAAAHHPIEGARVSILQSQAGASPLPLLSATTSGDGVARFIDVADLRGTTEAAVVSVESDRHIDCTVTWKVSETSVAVELEAGVELFGRIAYRNDDPVADKSLTLHSVHEASAMTRGEAGHVNTVLETSTDGEGYYCFYGVDPNREYRMNLNAPPLYLIGYQRTTLSPSRSPHCFYVGAVCAAEIKLVDRSSLEPVTVGTGGDHVVEVHPDLNDGDFRMLMADAASRAGIPLAPAARIGVRTFAFLVEDPNICNSDDASIVIVAKAAVPGYEPASLRFRAHLGPDRHSEVLYLDRKQGWFGVDFELSATTTRHQTCQNLYLVSRTNWKQKLRYPSVPISEGALRNVLVPGGEWVARCYGTPDGKETSFSVDRDGMTFRVEVDRWPSLRIAPQTTEGDPVDTFSIVDLRRKSDSKVISANVTCSEPLILQYMPKGTYTLRIRVPGNRIAESSITIDMPRAYEMTPVIE